jgi:hypothetical protein
MVSPDRLQNGISELKLLMASIHQAFSYFESHIAGIFGILEATQERTGESGTESPAVRNVQAVHAWAGGMRLQQRTGWRVLS